MHKTEIKKSEKSIVGNTSYTFCEYFYERETDER